MGGNRSVEKRYPKTCDSKGSEDGLIHRSNQRIRMFEPKSEFLMRCLQMCR